MEKAGEILKKEEGVNLQTMTNREKAVLVGALRDTYSLTELFVYLKLSKSSYFYQVKAIQKEDKYADLRKDICKEFEKANSSYGYRRICIALKNLGKCVSEKVVRRIMKQESLVVPYVRKRKYNSYLGEISPAVENVIQRDFHADAPNQKWLTDITEFNIPAGKVYLVPMIDCFDGMAVAWSIGTSPNAKLCNSMLDKAISQLGDERPIVHSDRGGHFRWPGWISRMKKANLTRSMSKKGCSPDNAACEGFFGRLKNEMFYGRKWEGISIETFIDLLDNYIHWYNEERIKLSLGGLSPVQFRQAFSLI